MQARYQSGSQARFLSQDPVFWEIGQTKEGKEILLNPQAQNSYAYANGNPVTYSDPNGRFVPLLIGAAFMYGPAIISTIETGLGAYVAYQVAQATGTVIGTALSNAPQNYKNGVYDTVAENAGAMYSAYQVLPRGGNITSKIESSQIESNSVSKVINTSKQGKHIEGHNNYKEGNSILQTNAQSLLNKFHAGNIESTQKINDVKIRVDFGKFIGTYKNEGSNAQQTTIGTIHNSKNGAHIVPSRPKN